MHRRSVLLAAAALTGCGFELRREPELPFKTLALTGFAPDSPLAAGLRRLAADPDAQVRYQLGWTLGVVRIPGKAVALATLLRHGAGDRWQQVAALNAATENHSEIIKSLTTDEAFAGSKVSTRIVTRLETMAAGRLAKVSASSAGEYHAQLF